MKCVKPAGLIHECNQYSTYMCNTYTQTYEHSIVYHIQLLGEGEGLEDLLKTVHEECKVLERKETQEVLLQLEIWKCLKGTHIHIQIKSQISF